MWEFGLTCRSCQLAHWFLFLDMVDHCYGRLLGCSECAPLPPNPRWREASGQGICSQLSTLVSYRHCHASRLSPGSWALCGVLGLRLEQRLCHSPSHRLQSVEKGQRQLRTLLAPPVHLCLPSVDELWQSQGSQGRQHPAPAASLHQELMWTLPVGMLPPHPKTNQKIGHLSFVIQLMRKEGRKKKSWPQLLSLTMRPFLVTFCDLRVLSARQRVFCCSLFSSGGSPGAWKLKEIIHWSQDNTNRNLKK